MNRALTVVRIHAMDRVTVVVLPWLVLAAALVLNVVIWALLPEAAANGSGGILSLYGFFVAMIAALIGRGFPFQVGLGVTRRDFVAGTALLIAAYSVACAVILIALNLLDRATDGFGLGGRFFRAPWFTAVPDWQLLGIYAQPMVFFLGFGMLYAAVWSRYKTTGGAALTIGLALIGVAAVAAITWRDSWPRVGTWFADLEPLPGTLILGGLGALAIGASWLTLRRAPV